jgi:hypothetical protein
MSESAIDRLNAAIDARAALDTSGWTPAERSAELLELLEAQVLLDTAIRRLITEAGEGSGPS